MVIDKYKDYVVSDYTFKNFVTLPKEILLMILKERNHPDVKKWMITKEDISETEHLKYVEGLKNREDAFYWLILHSDVPIGVLSLLHCDFEKEEGVTGYYLFADQQDSGLGLDMQYHYKKFFFEVLEVKNLLGEILWGNTNAYQMSMFFGQVVDGIEERDGRKYIIAHTPVENFKKIENHKLASQFIKYIKANPIKWE